MRAALSICSAGSLRRTSASVPPLPLWLNIDGIVLDFRKGGRKEEGTLSISAKAIKLSLAQI